jgi:indole-3-glycerol phosphate synthase
VHDEREMDRVLGIDGIQLIGINNRNLGMHSLVCVLLSSLEHVLYQIINKDCLLMG